MLALALIVLMLVAVPGSALAASDTDSDRRSGQPRDALVRDSGRAFVPGELIVRFRSDAGRGARVAARRSTGARFARALPGSGLQLVRIEPGTRMRSAITAFERDPNVLYAEPNRVYQIAGLPNDSRFNELWALSNSGQSVASTTGVADADIDAPEAWDVTTGSSAVTVAVADTGVAYDHPELRSNMWRNRGEQGGGKETNGRDDDGNGFVDDWRGWDFVSKDNDPRDMNGHGSHVAGTIGARGNDGAGITGVNWRVKLMALRVANSGGALTEAAIISSFDYAADNGARIVNASFTSTGASQALFDTIRRHPETLFVSAAGNGDEDGVGDDNDRVPQYPCNFSLVNVVCVAASDQADKLTSFSNYGARAVDLAAPGSNVLSALPAYSQPLFSEGFESDLGATWRHYGDNDSWDRITGVAHTGSYSLSDSPGTTYLDFTDSFVETLSPFSLSGRLGCRVEYALRLSTEIDADKLSLEASRDKSNWTAISEMSGSTGGSFFELSDDLGSFDTEPSVYLRYRLKSNGSVISDGAQLDDVSVRCLSTSYAGTELGYREGTSMAAPHVSGVTALVWAKYPTLGTAGVRDAVLRGVDKKPSFAGKLAQAGRLNARRSLNEAARMVPGVELSGPKRQALTRQGAVIVYARCRKTCALIATGSLSAGSSASAAPLKKVTRSLRGGRRKRIAVRLSRRALAAARRALARHRRVTTTVRVTVSDSRGNSISRARNIRLKR